MENQFKKMRKSGDCQGSKECEPKPEKEKKPSCTPCEQNTD